jgi:hypothetical protein
MKTKLHYEFIYHFNTYTGLWNCFHREDIRSYFNGFETTRGVGKGKTVKEATLNKKIKDDYEN